MDTSGYKWNVVVLHGPAQEPFFPWRWCAAAGTRRTRSASRILLGRIKQKRPEKSILLTGLRGVGKTVLLNEIDRLAKAADYRTIVVEAHEDKALGPLIAPHLRSLLFELDRIAGAGEKVK